MKIVYIPVTIPWNLRSLIAMILLFIGIAILLVCAFLPKWWYAEFKISPMDPYDPDRIRIAVGIKSRTIEECGKSREIEDWLCTTRYFSVFDCLHQKYPPKPNWCDKPRNAIFFFFLLVGSAGLGVLTIFISFVREKFLGFGGLLVTFAAVSAIVLTKFTIIDHFKDTAVVEQKAQFANAEGVYLETWSYRSWWNFPFHLCGFAALCSFVASVISLTLLCFAKGGQDNPAHHPPQLYVVTEANAGGSMEQIRKDGTAEVAPQPGFVALRGRDTADDDVELRQI